MTTNTAWATDLTGDVDLDTCCVASSVGGRAHCTCWYPATPTHGRTGRVMARAPLTTATVWWHPAGYFRPIPAPPTTAREAA